MLSNVWTTSERMLTDTYFGVAQNKDLLRLLSGLAGRLFSVKAFFGSKLRPLQRHFGLSEANLDFF